MEEEVLVNATIKKKTNQYLKVDNGSWGIWMHFFELRFRDWISFNSKNREEGRKWKFCISL